ncbi:MAG: transglutaminase family protein [Leptospira sp.]|nr:transglutaminase family protein [Leptospira sp.]
MKKYKVQHKTVYEYEKNVSSCHNLLQMVPRNSEIQEVTRHSIRITPSPSAYHEYSDENFGNISSYFTVHSEHKTLEVDSEFEAILSPRSEIKLEESLPAREMRKLLKDFREPMDIFFYKGESPRVPLRKIFRSFAFPAFKSNEPFLIGIKNLMGFMKSEFQFDAKATNVNTPVEKFFRLKRGVCQDFAHFAIACLRSMGYSARYVSGYIETIPLPGVEKLKGADASHAWVSVYCPGMGWVDFDPTNDMFPMDRHITVAWGRDYSDVTPLKGIIYGGGKHSLKVTVDVDEI